MPEEYQGRFERLGKPFWSADLKAAIERVTRPGRRGLLVQLLAENWTLCAVSRPNWMYSRHFAPSARTGKLARASTICSNGLAGEQHAIQ